MSESVGRQLLLTQQDNVLCVSGEVDFANVSKFLRFLNRMRHEYQTVIVDLSGVAYMDSTGFGVLLRACRELRYAGGQLVLRRPSPHVRRMLEVTDMLRFFQLDERPHAVASA